MTNSSGKGRVVFVNRFFHPDQSATSQILTDLATYLAEQGWSVTVLTSRFANGSAKALPKNAEHDRVRIQRIWSLPQWGASNLSKALSFASFYPAALLQLIRTLRRGDVLVTKTDPPLISVVGMVAAKTRGAAHVNWLQDLYPEVAVQLQTPMLTGWVGRILTRFRDVALKSAAMNVAIGSRMAQRLLGRGAERISVIPNWADERALQPVDASTSSTRRGLGLSPSQFILGYSGNLGRAHEFSTLLSAAKLLSSRSDITFLFLGGGFEMRKLQLLVEQERLPNFLFLPHQPRSNLSDSLGAADAHWLSLRPELEGLIVPSKLYGILAAGRAVLAVSDPSGEAAEIVRTHECGMVIQPGDAVGLANGITGLADDSNFCAAMGRNARNAAERQFSKLSALEKWAGLLTEISSRAATQQAPDLKHLQAGQVSK